MILTKSQIRKIEKMEQFDSLIFKTHNSENTQYKIELASNNEYRVVFQTDGGFCLRSDFAMGVKEVSELIYKWN